MTERVKVVGIIQARMSSTRLPGKVLSRIAGHRLIEWVVMRARASNRLDAVVVAIGADGEETPLVAVCAEMSVPTFVGDTADVLGRYYYAAKESHATTIVRITSDCPLLDPDVVDEAVDTFFLGGFDYLSNTIPARTFPHGLDVEVFSSNALEKAFAHATAAFDREHVTPYIWKHADRFRLGSLTFKEDVSSIRVTVDEVSDLAVVEKVLQYDPDIRLSGLVSLFRERPQLFKENSDAAERWANHLGNPADGTHQSPGAPAPGNL